jgi:hypothetical protein
MKKVTRNEVDKDVNVRSEKLIEAAPPNTNDCGEGRLEQERGKRIVQALKEMTQAKSIDWWVGKECTGASITICLNNGEDGDGTVPYLLIVNNNELKETEGDEIISELKRGSAGTFYRLDISDCNQLEHSIYKDSLIKKWEEDSL